jgi:hypothetical protein
MRSIKYANNFGKRTLERRGWEDGIVVDFVNIDWITAK